MAAGKLLDSQRSRIGRKGVSQEEFELGQSQLFARSDTAGRSRKSAISLCRTYRYVSNEGFIQVRNRVESAQCELLARAQEFAVRAVSGHPCYADVSRGERFRARCMATPIGPPELKMTTCSPAQFSRDVSFESPAVHSGTEFRPGFHILQRKFSVDPPAYYALEHPLKSLAFLFGSDCALKCACRSRIPASFWRSSGTLFRSTSSP